MITVRPGRWGRLVLRLARLFRFRVRVVNLYTTAGEPMEVTVRYGPMH
jgi:hypothetical protein